MSQARDRSSSPLDVATIYARRRASILGISDLDPLSFGSSPRQEGPTGSGGVGAPRNAFIGRGRTRALHAPGTENIGPLRGGRGRDRSSVLPMWYPRTPLRDITAVVRAIERRRVRFVENEGQQTGILFSADQLLPHSPVFSPKSVGVKFRTPAGSKVREELQKKLKKPPSAKNAEREKRVRTLMSMR